MRLFGRFLAAASVLLRLFRSPVHPATSSTGAPYPRRELVPSGGVYTFRASAVARPRALPSSWWGRARDVVFRYDSCHSRDGYV